MSLHAWQLQPYDKPLFEDIIWNRPEQKHQAGKLLIIGGNIHSISAPNSAHTYAIGQGIGSCKVALPDKTRKIFGSFIPPNIELLHSNSVGSFSTDALEDLIRLSNWADGTLFAGDFSRNSQTAILLDKLIGISNNQILVGDSIDYFYTQPKELFSKKSLLIVVDLKQLQKLVQPLSLTNAITSQIDLIKLVDTMNKLTTDYDIAIITKLSNNVICCYKGDSILTKIPANVETNWQIKVAASAAVWWIQNQGQLLKAIATSITQIKD